MTEHNHDAQGEPFVFLSYSRKDATFARRLRMDLTAAGIRVGRALKSPSAKLPVSDPYAQAGSSVCNSGKGLPKSLRRSVQN